MDEAVTQQLAGMGAGNWHPKSTPMELTMVLSAVVIEDDRLDQTLCDFWKARDFLIAHPMLLPKLDDAWRTKSFRDIRDFDILQQPVETSAPMSETKLAGLRRGLTTNYQGDAVQAFYEYLQHNNIAYRQGSKYYAKFCSIVQSSGTGKTRLLLELASKGVYVLYMNIRSPRDNQGYPLRDPIPAEILTHPGATESQYRMRCTAFFTAVFKVLHVYAEKDINWRTEMCRPESATRASFFSDVYSEYRILRSKRRTASEPGETEVMKKHYQDMVESVNSCISKDQQDRPRVVIAFDEAHTLHAVQASPSSLYATVLLRVIKEFSNRAAVWVVFTSTTSKVVHFAPPQPLFPSINGELLFPPFSQLGWDQNSPLLSELQPDEVAVADRVIQHGRPLWVSMKEAVSLEEIFELAKQKLCGEVEFDPTNKHQAFAVVSQRFGLDIAFGSRDAVRFNETSVASHLRVCIKTTEDRNWSYTCYPSEPLLSSAAASLLHERNPDDTHDTHCKLYACFSTIGRMINDGMVEIGQIGELVSRFIWLLAKDFLVRTKVPGATNDMGSQFNTELIDCQPIPVVEYLTFVFGPEVWHTVPQAQELFKDAFINFSHWISMDHNIHHKRDDEELTIEEWTLCHWQRSCAVQCCHGQPLVDKVIPIYFKRQQQGEPIMSQMFISDKAGRDEHTADLEHIQRDHHTIAPEGYRGPPWIAILVDLGLKGGQLKVGLDSLEDGNQCLRIYAPGLDATCYPFLQGHDDLTRTLRDLYQRQAPTTVTGTRRLAQGLEDQIRYGASSNPRHMHTKKKRRMNG